MPKRRYNKSGNLGILFISQPFMTGKDLTKAVRWAECTRAQMANHLGISLRTMRNWEKDEDKPLPPMVQRDVFRLLNMEKEVGGKMVSALD